MSSTEVAAEKANCVGFALKCLVRFKLQQDLLKPTLLRSWWASLFCGITDHLWRVILRWGIIGVWNCWWLARRNGWGSILDRRRLWRVDGLVQGLVHRNFGYRFLGLDWWCQNLLLWLCERNIERGLGSWSVCCRCLNGRRLCSRQLRGDNSGCGVRISGLDRLGLLRINLAIDFALGVDLRRGIVCGLQGVNSCLVGVFNWRIGG
jgi:hypothetical protein